MGHLYLLPFTSSPDHFRVTDEARVVETSKNGQCPFLLLNVFSAPWGTSSDINYKLGILDNYVLPILQTELRRMMFHHNI